MQMQMKSPFDSWPWYLFSQLTFQGHHPPERPPGAVVQWLEIAGLDPPPFFLLPWGVGPRRQLRILGVLPGARALRAFAHLPCLASQLPCMVLPFAFHFSSLLQIIHISNVSFRLWQREMSAWVLLTAHTPSSVLLHLWGPPGT